MTRGSLAFIACAMALAACSGESSPAKSKGRGDVAAVTVTLREVELRALSETLQAMGTVRACESVALSANVTEIVQTIHFESGDEVRSGQTLVTLRDEGQRAALYQAQAQADDAERLYRRANELAKSSLIPLSQLDSSLSTRDAARARVLQMRAAISDRVIKAPFAGKLGVRQISAGSLLTPDTVVATLDDISRVFVDFHLPETELPLVEIEARVTARSSAWPSDEYVGRISALDVRIDPSSRTVLARAEFRNSDLHLRPGMLMEVSLTRRQRQALLVPEIAVLQVGSDSFVFLVDATGIASRTGVKIGLRSGSEVEILEGIRTGDRIVVDGLAKVRNGSKVVDGHVKQAARPSAGPA